MAYVIAVDSGHGLETAGKRTPPLQQDLVINGVVVRKKGEIIHEKEWNRPTADYLIAALQRCGFQTVDCAPGTQDVSLLNRVAAANNAGADLLVSKHYNAANGQWWQPGYSVGFVCPKNTATIEASRRAAGLVMQQLAELYNEKTHGVQDDTAFMGISLYILKNAKMPALLTESGFMDVPAQAARMLDPAAQKADAEATCRGICQYFNQPYLPPADCQAPVQPSPAVSQLYPCPATVATSSARLYLRAQPAAGSTILAAMPKGQAITLTGPAQNGWYPVICGSQAGYASAQYIAPGSPTPQASTTGTAAPPAWVAPQTAAQPMYRVQCGAYTNPDNANRQLAALQKAEFDAQLVYQNGYHRVFAGPAAPRADAQALLARAVAANFDSLLVEVDSAPV